MDEINHLNGPSPIHDTSTWLSQSIQSIRHVCCRLGMQKNLPWKCFRTAFGHCDFPSTSASQQVWRMRKRYHLLLLGHNPFWPDKHLLSHISMNRMTIDFLNHLQDYRSKWTPLRPCLCMKKSCPRKEGHPLSWVNFSECLHYEKKVNPFARANLCCHMLRLLKTVFAHVILLCWPVWAIQSVHMEKSWPG